MATKKPSPSTTLARMKTSLARRRADARQQTAQAVGAAVALGTGVAIGALRGKFADENGDLNVGPTDVPWEVVIGAGLGAVGMLGYGGALAPVALDAGKTTLAIFLARYTEKKVNESEAAG